MNNEIVNKAPKDKICPYCGQAFTSSSLGRHLDLYIKDKNPKAPDGIHDVEEIRKLRGTITRRHPRRGSRRNTTSSAAAGSQSGSKRSPMGSDAESTRSPEDDNGPENTQRGHSQRVINRQIMKSSLKVRHQVQDALDTAKAAELALREMISSWRAVKHQSSIGTMPFEINPLSLDFPALCLQFLEPPPTLYSSTPHTTSTSWSINPPDHKQKDALTIYFCQQFRKWKASCAAATAVAAEDLTCRASLGTTKQEDINSLVQRADEVAVNLEKKVAEHLSVAYQTWDILPAQRQLESWNLEMARTIGRKQKQVSALQETQYSLKQQNANLKSQLDSVNLEKQPKEFRIIPPMTLKVDEAMKELWVEAGPGDRSARGLDMGGNHTDLGTLVSGAIERWKSVVVASRTASSIHLQREFDHASAPIKTPMSATYPMTPDISRSTQQKTDSNVFSHNAHSSPNGSGANTSGTNTPTQLLSDSEDDIDAEAEEDADAEADVDMVHNEFLTSTTAPTHHTVPRMPQQQAAHMHTTHLGARTQGQDVTILRHNAYPQRGNSFVTPNILPSQQVPMNQQVFDHQMQNLTHHLSQGHSGVGMGWEGQ